MANPAAANAETFAPSTERPQKFADWLPFLILLPAAAAAGPHISPWAFMWTLALAVYAGFKWLTWRRSRKEAPATAWRSAAYLLAWPGMDAEAFLNVRPQVARPCQQEWAKASAQTALGAILLWGVARALPESLPLLQGWAGMAGMILLLHFGTFQLAALFWQKAGIDAQPIMCSPLRSRSLGEFWGRRWNRGFHQIAYDLVFVPLRRRLGAGAAGFTVFLLSGLIHDLVISLPARGGLGLPTMYFVVQGAGAAVEHSRLGTQLGLRRGISGRLFAGLVLVAPLFWLFHPAFVLCVVLPCMRAIGAL